MDPTQSQSPMTTEEYCKVRAEQEHTKEASITVKIVDSLVQCMVFLDQVQMALSLKGKVPLNHLQIRYIQSSDLETLRDVFVSKKTVSLVTKLHYQTQVLLPNAPADVYYR